jgi:hypothetical protein
MTPADPALLRTECILQNDSRLIAAFSAVILDAARRANLSERAQDSLKDAVLQACRLSFDILEKSGEEGPKIQLVTTDFPDRVEVTIDYPGKMAPEFEIASNGAIGDLSGKADGNRSADGAVDLLSHFMRDGHSRVTLTKFSPSRNSHRND